MFLDASASRLVNLPDDVIDKLTKAITKDKSTPPDLFDVALKETMSLLCDNIYNVYLKEQQPPEEVITPAQLPKGSGGCCLLM